MKAIKLIIVAIQLSIGFTLIAQNNVVVPDLSKVKDSNLWTLINREFINDDVVHLNGEPSQGLLILNETNFENGKIELDIKA